MPTAWHGATAYPGQRRFLKYVALTGSDDEGPTLAEVLYKEHPSQPISISRLEGPTLKRRAFFCSWETPGTVLYGSALCADVVKHCPPGMAWPLPSGTLRGVITHGKLTQGWANHGGERGS